MAPRRSKVTQAGPQGIQSPKASGETYVCRTATLTWISRQFVEVIHEPKIVETDMVVDLNIKSTTLSVAHGHAVAK